MWIVFLLVLVNGWGNQRSFINEWRITVGGLPIGIIDGLQILSLMAGLAVCRSARRVAVPRVHPLLIPSLILAGVAILLGILEAMQNGVELRQWVTATRNWGSFPLAILTGYLVTTTFRSSRVYLWAVMLGGVIVSAMILWNFTSRGRVASSNDLNTTMYRTVDYISSMGAVAAIFMLGAKVLRLKFLWPWYRMAAIAFCIVGGNATLHRSDWLATVVTMLALLVFIVPPRVAMSQAPRIALLSVLLLAAVYGALLGASSITRTDFVGRMHERVMTMLPGGESKERAAWETRIPGAVRELNLFLENPFSGKGVGYQYMEMMAANNDLGYFHNAWTSTMAQFGLLGLTFFLMTIGGAIVIGWRMVRHVYGDNTVMLVGLLSAVSGVYYAIHGMATGSFNGQRPGLALGLTLGVVLRVRMMQLTTDAYEAELQQYASLGEPTYLEQQGVAALDVRRGQW